ETRAGAPAVRVLARQVPVLEEVVRELAVVGDVRQVFEDLLAGPVDDYRDADGVHRAAILCAPRRNEGRAAQAARGMSRTACPCSLVRTDSERSGSPPCRRRQSSQTTMPRSNRRSEERRVG